MTPQSHKRSVNIYAHAYIPSRPSAPHRRTQLAYNIRGSHTVFLGLLHHHAMWCAMQCTTHTHTLLLWSNVQLAHNPSVSLTAICLLLCILSLGWLCFVATNNVFGALVLCMCDRQLSIAGAFWLKRRKCSKCIM